MTNLVPVVRPEDIASLPVEQRGQVITQALEESKSWLAVATKGTDPTPIAEFKAWAATIAEMTRQKGLAEDIQLDAVEMVRRAERGIGVVIRKGQEAGEIRTARDARGPCRSYTRADGTVVQVDRGDDVSTISPSAFASKDELTSHIYPLTDDVTDEQFEEAIGDAREEKNLTRANVVRKAHGLQAPLTRRQKAEKIREMAAGGFTSRQIAQALGVGVETVRVIRIDYEIEAPSADRFIRGTRHIDPERVVQETVSTLQGIEYGLGLLTQADYDAFTPEQARAWLGALKTPARAIRVLLKELNDRV